MIILLDRDPASMAMGLFSRSAPESVEIAQAVKILRRPEVLPERRIRFHVLRVKKRYFFVTR
jgi:hypothetical protein